MYQRASSGGGGDNVGNITYYQASFTNHSTTYTITKSLKVLIAAVISASDYRTAPNLNGSTTSETFKTTNLSGMVFRNVAKNSIFKIEYPSGSTFATVLIMIE